MPGPDLCAPTLAGLIEAEQVTVAAGVPTIWMGVLPELDGPRHVPHPRHPVRRLGRAQVAVGGLPGGDRQADHAGLGHDRDQPGGLGRAR